MKKIIRKEFSNRTHMVGDGFKVSQVMPGYGRNMAADTSPFLMLDYNAPFEVKWSLIHQGGVGYHPHRGFETVTISYSGEIEHNDTYGHHGVILQDEVQWMTAGSGLFHKEFLSKKFSQNGGIVHFVQLWVDLPKDKKMTEPKYQTLTRDSIPEVSFDSGTVRVIAGNYENITGAAKTFSELSVFDIRFEKDGKMELEIPKWWNSMTLIVEQSVVINAENLEHGNMAYWSKEWEKIVIEGKASSKILFIAGEPLGNNVVNYGPFVMTSPEEIMQAFKDMNAGKMGNPDM